MNLVKLLFSFSGRTGRAMLWLSALIWIVALTLVIGAGIMMASVEAGLRAGLWVSALGLVSAIAVGVKRLHDRNKNPLWLLLFYGMPIALLYISSLLTEGTDPASQPTSVTILGYTWLAISLWALVELGMIRGTIGPNPHGPDPIAPKPAPARAH
jgi:uncharacterized membrane protein YhaH (DUF805 family)